MVQLVLLLPLFICLTLSSPNHALGSRRHWFIPPLSSLPFFLLRLNKPSSCSFPSPVLLSHPLNGIPDLPCAQPIGTFIYSLRASNPITQALNEDINHSQSQCQLHWYLAASCILIVPDHLHGFFGRLDLGMCF